MKRAYSLSGSEIYHVKKNQETKEEKGRTEKRGGRRGCHFKRESQERSNLTLGGGRTREGGRDGGGHEGSEGLEWAGWKTPSNCWSLSPVERMVLDAALEDKAGPDWRGK